jgi:hypothetical protein
MRALLGVSTNLACLTRGKHFSKTSGSGSPRIRQRYSVSLALQVRAIATSVISRCHGEGMLISSFSFNREGAGRNDPKIPVHGFRGLAVLL